MGWSELIKVDVRENNGPIPSLLRSMNVKFDTVVLEVGDYVVGDVVCIERKEVGDYLNSLFDGRLHTQLYEMSRNYEVSVLIVEGNLLKEAWKRRMVNPKLCFISCWCDVEGRSCWKTGENLSFIPSRRGSHGPFYCEYE